jgi:crossover junction endodeoxyribonuclease RuvC
MTVESISWEDWLAQQPPETPVCIGIDPGTTGAIAAVCATQAYVLDIPIYHQPTKRTHHGKTKKVQAAEVDYPGIVALFAPLLSRREQVWVAIEQVPPRTSQRPISLADVKLYGSMMIWPLFLASQQLRWRLVRPTEWKKSLGLTGKDKEASRQRALQLFPAQEQLARKKDHHRAEAVLLAYWQQQHLPVLSANTKSAKKKPK